MKLYQNIRFWNFTSAEHKTESEKEYSIYVYVWRVRVCGSGTSAENVNMLRKRVCTVFLSFFSHTQLLPNYLQTMYTRVTATIHRLTSNGARTMRCSAMNVVCIKIIIII